VEALWTLVAEGFPDRGRVEGGGGGFLVGEDDVPAVGAAGRVAFTAAKPFLDALLPEDVFAGQHHGLVGGTEGLGADDAAFDGLEVRLDESIHGSLGGGAGTPVAPGGQGFLRDGHGGRVNVCGRGMFAKSEVTNVEAVCVSTWGAGSCPPGCSWYMLSSNTQVNRVLSAMLTGPVDIVAMLSM
jgi:hypothetical protein